MDDPWGSPWNSSASQAVLDSNSHSDKIDTASIVLTKGGFKSSQLAPIVDSVTSPNGNAFFALKAEPSPWAEDETFGEFHSDSDFGDNDAFGDWNTSVSDKPAFAIASSTSGWGDFCDEPAEKRFADEKNGIDGFAQAPKQDSWEKSPVCANDNARAEDATREKSTPQLKSEVTSTPILKVPETTSNEATSNEEVSPMWVSRSRAASFSPRSSSASSDSSKHSHIETEDVADAGAGDQQHGTPTTSVGDTHGDLSCDLPKTSSKVQGLVELFDSLATRYDAVETAAASSSRAASGQRGLVDFDEGIETTEAAEAAEQSPISSVLDEKKPTASDETASLDAAKPAPPDTLRDNALRTDGQCEGKGEPVKASKEAEFAEACVTVPSLENDSPVAASKDVELESATAVVGAHVPKKQETAGKVISGAPSALCCNGLSSSRLLAIWGKQDPFRPDLAKINAFFPKTLPPIDKDNDKSRLDAFIPDYILSDSFTCISERKAWYRIARHGSSRKHDLGGSTDDGNYRPITWRTSVIRDETVKIVRRWMEEDSFTGKPTLGGGSSGSSGASGGGKVFGWDSAAAPVSLNEVFKKKRHFSNQPKEVSTTTLSTSARDGRDGSAGALSPVLTAGGFSLAAELPWSGGGSSAAGQSCAATPEAARDATNVDRASPMVAAAPLPFASPPSAGRPSRFSLILPPADLAPSLSVAEHSSPYKASEAVDNDEDTDEDWGEMVTSPTPDTHTLPAPPFSPPTPAASVHAFVPAASVTPQSPTLDAPAVASRIDSILRNLPNLSYMAM
ncbi:hypothetical protein SEPCBS119000_006282 [Sporothrix epigloea]|uniref:Uncharacterized protein n=1 Tax=Sporothrix epigloea TaxID=1892477 RepID=A0ABP0E2J5_9PEZI